MSDHVSKHGADTNMEDSDVIAIRYEHIFFK